MQLQDAALVNRLLVCLLPSLTWPPPAGELLTLARELRKIHTVPCGGKGLQLQVSTTRTRHVMH